MQSSCHWDEVFGWRMASSPWDFIIHEIWWCALIKDALVYSQIVLTIWKAPIFLKVLLLIKIPTALWRLWPPTLSGIWDLLLSFPIFFFFFLVTDVGKRTVVSFHVWTHILPNPCQHVGLYGSALLLCGAPRGALLPQKLAGILHLDAAKEMWANQWVPAGAAIIFPPGPAGSDHKWSRICWPGGPVTNGEGSVLSDPGRKWFKSGI